MLTIQSAVILQAFVCCLGVKLYEFRAKIPCNNLTTGEKGVCIVNALHCYLANGVHISTCINKQRIGSCCKFLIFTSDVLKLLNAPSVSTESFYESKHHTEAPLTSFFKKDFITDKRPYMKKVDGHVLGLVFPLSHNLEEAISNNGNFPIPSHNMEKQKHIQWQGNFHNIRHPVVVDTFHDQRHSVVQDKSHDMRKPVMQQMDHNLRKPVAIEPSHNMHVLSSMYAFQNISACGISRTYSQARIVGGFQSDYLKWPWMISLSQLEGNKYKHKCGAVLLNQWWAISVAHCIYRQRATDILLRLEEYDLHHTNELHAHIEMRVHHIIPHPEFNYLTYENDIALLRFYYSIPFPLNIAPICLPQFSDDSQGQTAVVTGWGKLAQGGDLPRYLHEVHLPILSNEECEDMYAEAGYFEIIPNTFLCAGFRNGGLDACEGDSGGPMMIKNKDGQWSLIGLISWGIGCATPKQPGVYTRITKYIGWIKRTITQY